MKRHVLLCLGLGLGGSAVLAGSPDPSPATKSSPADPSAEADLGEEVVLQPFSVVAAGRAPRAARLASLSVIGVPMPGLDIRDFAHWPAGRGLTFRGNPKFGPAPERPTDDKAARSRD